MSDDWPPAGTLMAFRYRLVSRLETGGMAEIWHAEDELLDRPVALKLPTGLDPARIDSLQLAWREARMAARLSHPNIAAVHDYDEAVRPEGSVAPFVVMELLAGETLAARLHRAPLSWPVAAEIGVAVADALTAAHANGVVHRDIKPGNVMLTPTGVKLLDFGISAVAGEPDDDETGRTFGTPAYVAPERLDGKPAEPATDVYGLGVLLFEMVTGDPPYPVDTWEELAVARTRGRAALPGTLPAPFRDLVARCLAEEPDQRPRAADVGRDLTALIQATKKTHNPRRVRGRVALWSGIVAVAVSIIAVFLTIGSSRQDDNAQPAPAATPPVSLLPSRPAPSGPAATRKAPPPPPSRTATRAPAPLSVSDALSRVRSSIRTGQARDQIRPDVADDLLNLLQPLARSGGGDRVARVEELQRKVEERAGEGSIDNARADVLRSRLADLATALGSG